MPEDFPYQKEWEEYRRRRKAFYAVLVLAAAIYIPLLFFYLPGNSAEGTQPGVANLFISLGLLLLVIVVAFFAIRFNLWKCPKCGKAFHGGLFMTNILSEECGKCGLPKFAGSNLDLRAGKL